MYSTEDSVYVSTTAVRTTDLIDALQQLHPLTQNIELTGGCAHDPLLLHKLVAYRAGHPVNLLLHSYCPPPANHFVLNFADTGDQTRSFIAESMRYVMALDVPYYSIHAGFRADFRADSQGLLHSQTDRTFSVEGIKENVAWFRQCWPVIPLALENVYPNNGNTSCAFMMSLDEIIELLETIPDVFLLLDLGHLKVSANLLGFAFRDAAELLFRQFRERIIEIHLSENDACIDDHFPLTAESPQLALLRQWAPAITEQRIRVTLEMRAEPLSVVHTSLALARAALIPVAAEAYFAASWEGLAP